MPRAPGNWNFVTQSEHAHERRAIEFLAEHLPDHEPYAGWSNFEFTSTDGAYNEVDALVVSKAGCFLVEIKSHPGRLVRADQQTLHIEAPDGRPISIPHPIRLANLKAKRLRELLKREAKAASIEIPFIEPLCFLSDLDGFDPGIAPHVLTGLAVRDPERRSPPAAEDRAITRPGIMAAILERSAAGLPAEPRRIDGQPGYIDKPRRKLIERCLESIGFRTRSGHRLIGDWRIVETIEEAEYFRDVLVEHDRRPDKRRARIYFASSAPEASLTASQIEAAASREAALLERLRHEGILAYRDHQPSDEGPVLFFESTEGFETLESWCTSAAAEPGRPEHGVAARLGLLRSIAEAVAYAHGQHVVHRGLAPEGILVRNENGRLAVRIMNWQSGGVSPERASTHFEGTLHPGEYHAGRTSAYAAPELVSVGEAIEPTLDVFSLGAIAYRLFADAAPAANREEMISRLSKEAGSLDLPTAPAEIDSELRSLVRTATSAACEQRYATVGEFLAAIDAIEHMLRGGGDDQCDSIEEAAEGSRLAPGLHVVKRLGKGSTAYGFLVERTDADAQRERFILKIATDSDHNDRIDAEAKAIASLSHDHVIRTEGESFVLFGRRGFLGRPAGDRTLRDRLVKEGPIELELLERFGSELLSALSHLESKGVPHRDLKPENIAIVGAEARKALRLVLFDFSLADASPENLRVGTPAYLDPFLEERSPRRWDTSADRYSAALVLHEMATGTLPVWGQGKVPPMLTTGEIALDGDAFAAGVRDRMLRFFRRALARSPKNRFPDADAMGLEWREIFRDTRHAPTVLAADSLEASLDALVALQKADTPLSDIPLSTRAANVLDRQGVFTVRDLLQRPSNWLLSARGVGQKTRTELTELVRSLRRRFPDVVIDARAALERSGTAGSKGRGRREPESAEAAVREPIAPETLDLRQSLEALLAPLTKGERDMACALFDLAAAPDAPLSPLPTGSDVGRAMGVSRQRVQQVQNAIRKKWSASPITAALRQDLVARLDRNQGFLELGETARALAVDRGVEPIAIPDERNARALVGIACDLEAQETEPRYRLRRREDRQFVVASDDHLRYALDLGRKADQLVALDPLPDPRLVREQLSMVTRPEAIDPMPPDRLPRLAAAGSERADLSARGELYPIGLPLERAVRLAGATLGRLGSSDRTQPNDRRIARSEIVEQLRRRYPKASLAEDGPAIAAVLREQGWNEVRFDAARDELVTRLPDAVSVISPGSRLTVQTRQADAAAPAAGELEIGVARAFEQSLRSVFADKRFQVLLVQPEHHARAVAAITHRLGDLGIESVDLDVAITAAIDRTLAGRVPNPEVFYDAEAVGPEGRHWPNVLQVANLAIDEVKQSLAAGTSPLLFTHAGLLGRFGRNDLLELFNRTLTGRESPRGAVLLVAGDVAANAASLDGWAVPCLPDQVRPIPKAFLRSPHQALAV